LRNIWQLVKLFRVKTVANVTVKLIFEKQTVTTETEYDGFFKLEITPLQHLSAGWHTVMVQMLDDNERPVSWSDGRIFVPHVSQFAFISDIDDTIIRSFSAKIFKRLYELISRNPAKRRLFDATARHYSLLANSFTEDNLSNPFFYVSSSEWNLYDYLKNVFECNHLPEGIFLLNQIKKLKDLVATGKTGHDGKFLRIVRIMKAFPKQKFVLLGDNSQKDPEIYAKIATAYGNQVAAIYIRNVRPSRMEQTQSLLGEQQKIGISICIFKQSKEAIEHGAAIGLIDRNILAAF
jgi:phosphatidate phosphatase APP1